MCFSSPARFRTATQWEIGLPYVFSMEGKYEAGPLAMAGLGWVGFMEFLLSRRWRFHIHHPRHAELVGQHAER